LYGTMIFGKCASCGCPAKNHRIIYYNSITEYSEKIDENIEHELSENKIEQIYKQDHIKMLQEKIDQLKEQQDKVNKIIVKEKANSSENHDNNILEALEEIKRKYDEEVKVIKEMIENNEPSSCSLSSEDILELEQQLYGLPNVGKHLQAIKEEKKKAFKYRERRHKLTNMLNFLTKIFTTSNIWNCS
ncbi:15108_t:CDS:2, partial [Dentiscutata heterogama]